MKQQINNIAERTPQNFYSWSSFAILKFHNKNRTDIEKFFQGEGVFMLKKKMSKAVKGLAAMILAAACIANTGLQYMQRTDIAEIITGWIWITMNQQDARKRMDGAMGICFEIVPGELEM